MIMERVSFKLEALIFKKVFFPKRKASTQVQDNACDKIVARAAPRTPIPNTKMKIGSRIIFAAAPIITESMPVFAKPWAVINAFIPSVSCTKIVPRA